MIRALAEPLVFFTVPFLVYVVWLALRLINPLATERWTRRVVLPLAAVGLIFAVGSLLIIGLTAPRYEGGYVPAHLEDGHIVSGRMR